MNNLPHILVIEDERQTARALKTILTDEQFRVTLASGGETGLVLAATHPPDLILLDMDIRDMDSLDVCTSLRSWTQLPIIALSSQDNEPYKVRTLDLGADDFVTKPFSIGEMLARIRVALRRMARIRQRSNALIHNGHLQIDLENRIVTRAGAKVRLTATEFKLLAYLATNAGRLLTNQMILTQVWGPDDAGRVEYLRTYIRQLRKKLELEPGRPQLFLNEPQVGYRFVLDRQPITR